MKKNYLQLGFFLDKTWQVLVFSLLWSGWWFGDFLSPSSVILQPLERVRSGETQISVWSVGSLPLLNQTSNLVCRVQPVEAALGWADPWRNLDPNHKPTPHKQDASGITCVQGLILDTGWLSETHSLSDEQPVGFSSSTRSQAEMSLVLAPAIRPTQRRSWIQKWCCEIHRHSGWPLNRTIFSVYSTNESQATEDWRNPNPENHYFISNTLVSSGDLVISCCPISLLYSLIMIGPWSSMDSV